MADIKHPQDHHNPHGPQSPRYSIKKLTDKVNFGEDVDFIVGVTATAVTADQLLKQTTCKDHKVMHLAKAGLGAAVAATAFTMMTREHSQRKHAERLQHHNPHKERGRGYDFDSEDYNRRLSHSRSTKRQLITDSETDRPSRAEDWAVVRSDRYAPPPRRSASVYEGGNHNRNEDRNPDYYRASQDLPYPDDDTPARRRSISPEARSLSRGRRARSYSPPPNKHRDEKRSESKGGFTKLLEVVRDGMEKYDRYNSRR